MRLILAIVPQKDAQPLTDALLAAMFQVTKLASTGGFLRKGSVTLLVGTEDQRVDEVLATIKTMGTSEAKGEGKMIFVLRVDRLIRVDKTSDEVLLNS